MCLINSCWFYCFHSCFASIYPSTILPMQPTTLSYAVNYSILTIFKSKLKFRQKPPCTDHYSPRHQHRQPQVWARGPAISSSCMSGSSSCALFLLFALGMMLSARVERTRFLPAGNLAYQISKCSFSPWQNESSLLAKVSTQWRQNRWCIAPCSSANGSLKAIRLLSKWILGDSWVSQTKSSQIQETNKIQTYDSTHTLQKSNTIKERHWIKTLLVALGFGASLEQVHHQNQGRLYVPLRQFQIKVMLSWHRCQWISQFATI